MYMYYIFNHSVFTNLETYEIKGDVHNGHEFIDIY